MPEMFSKDKEKEIIKKVKRIEIKTRGVVNELFSGEYHTVFKGRGMNFAEVREYSYGDDIRNIDWNVTARMRHPFVKVFEEEREMVLMLLVDISGSGAFGSVNSYKREIATEIGAVLAFSAIKNNDKVGLILFSDKIEKFIPPKKGKSHVFRIIRELIYFRNESNGTSLEKALEYFTRVQKKKSTAFLISDFQDDNFDTGMQIVGRKHDLIAIELFDKKEREIPKIGLCQIKDNETGEVVCIDLSSEKNRLRLKKLHQTYIAKRDSLFKKCKVDKVLIDINLSYINPLMNLFKKRSREK